MSAPSPEADALRGARDGLPIEELVARHLRDVADFPQPGVLFKDITPLLSAPQAFGAVVTGLADRHRGQVDLVAGIEARGFILAAPLALALGVGFVPIRKVGKLPGEVVSQSYDLEYGSATIEVQADAVSPGQRVLLVDDVLATGGTAVAAWDLLGRVEAEVVELEVLIELSALGGRTLLAGRPVYALHIV